MRALGIERGDVAVMSSVIAVAVSHVTRPARTRLDWVDVRCGPASVATMPAVVRPRTSPVPLRMNHSVVLIRYRCVRVKPRVA